ncbi:hypothetical protein E2562_001701 [Oryza meyeriana var. granulata]|uniref:Uncharacterized protein n=1 Tax=Oryza meyeriana var. granulata TaxID=110450 RepID=A0A6G1CCZ8_9ORYZ|nr:hypothetical protein E2562_001701 [Oryza meyeriana var. granulata]
MKVQAMVDQRLRWPGEPTTCRVERTATTKLHIGGRGGPGGGAGLLGGGTGTAVGGEVEPRPGISSTYEQSRGTGVKDLGGTIKADWDREAELTSQGKGRGGWPPSGEARWIHATATSVSGSQRGGRPSEGIGNGVPFGGGQSTTAAAAMPWAPFTGGDGEWSAHGTRFRGMDRWDFEREPGDFGKEVVQRENGMQGIPRGKKAISIGEGGVG